MSDKSDKSEKGLGLFGLNSSEIEIYSYLLKSLPSTALQISRELKMARTRVYRILERLIKKGLVKELIYKPGRKYQAEPYQNLEYLLLEKENELERMKKHLPKIYGYLQNLQLQTPSKSKILYYKGVEGLKQITWNSLKAEKELYIYEISKGMHPFTGKKFAEKMREEFFLRKIVTKQLTNIRFFKPFTKIEQYVKHCMKLKYIDPKDLKMDFEVLIYNDVVAIYTYKKEIFGVEIYNPNLVYMQKQLFRYIWKNAEVMEVKKGGEARLRKTKVSV